MTEKSLRKLLLNLLEVTAMTCTWSGNVIAEGNRIEALEARIAGLESLVHQLLQNQAPPTVDTVAIDSSGIFGSYRHFWNEKWRSNLTLAYLAVDNDVALTGMSVTKNTSSIHLNLIYSPQPKLDFGVEFLYADREIENGTGGDLKRLQFSARYAY